MPETLIHNRLNMFGNILPILFCAARKIFRPTKSGRCRPWSQISFPICADPDQQERGKSFSKLRFQFFQYRCGFFLLFAACVNDWIPGFCLLIAGRAIDEAWAFYWMIMKKMSPSNRRLLSSLIIAAKDRGCNQKVRRECCIFLFSFFILKNSFH